jgi:hypothetical protein
MTIEKKMPAVLLAAVVGLGLSGCGEGDEVEAAETTEATEATEATEVEDAAGEVSDSGESESGPTTLAVATDSIVGLEVTAVGNVAEIVDVDAFRLDRDGLGSPADDIQQLPDTEYGYYDFDYDDFEDLTKNDEEFDDTDAVEQGVLVVNVAGEEISLRDPVRVSGTIRRADQETIENLYDLDLPDETWVEFEDRLLIVAHSVEEYTAAGSGGDSAAG